VRYLALAVTIAALAATFWISVGRHRADILHARSPAVAASAPATQHTGE
jgi:arginine:agmatine antiporter